MPDGQPMTGSYALHPDFRNYCRGALIAVVIAFLLTGGPFIVFFVLKILCVALFTLGDLRSLQLGGMFLVIIMFFFSVYILLGVALYSIFTWLRRASKVMASTTPIPVLLSTSNKTLICYRPRLGSSRFIDFVSIRPHPGATISFTEIVDMPLFYGLGRNQHRSRIYTDVPAFAYLPQRPGDPLVIECDGKCYCSMHGYEPPR